MTTEQITIKIRKLLRLARFGKGHEAKRAAEHAQRLMDKHGLEVTIDETEDGGGMVGEPMKLDQEFWREQLLIGIANAHRCYVQTPIRDDIDLPEAVLCGLREDVEDVRYLFDRLVKGIAADENRAWLEWAGPLSMGIDVVLGLAHRIWSQSFTITATFVLTEQRLKASKPVAAAAGGGAPSGPAPEAASHDEIEAANKLADDILRLARYIGLPKAQGLQAQADRAGAACAWRLDVELPRRVRGLLCAPGQLDTDRGHLLQMRKSSTKKRPSLPRRSKAI